MASDAKTSAPQPSKNISLTQDEVEAIMDSGVFKIRANSSTRSFMLKVIGLIIEFDSDKYINEATKFVDHETDIVRSTYSDDS